MKTFLLNGSSVNWAQFNLEALSVKGGYTETTTAIPAHLQVKVTLADKFDVLNPNLDDVSEATNRYAIRHGKHRHYLLLHKGKVVGWAAFHRVPQSFSVSVDYVTTESMIVYAKSAKEASELAKKTVEDTYGKDTVIMGAVVQPSDAEQGENISVF